MLHELLTRERKRERKKGEKEKGNEQHCTHINQSRLELLVREFARLIIKIDFIAVSGRIEINIFNCACERRLTVPPNVPWRDLFAITAADRFTCTRGRSFGLTLSPWRNFPQLIKNQCVLSNYVKQFSDYLFSDLSSRPLISLNTSSLVLLGEIPNQYSSMESFIF